MHGVSLSKAQCASTQDGKDCMTKISYALTIESIMYAMLCTYLDVSYALSKLGGISQFSVKVTGLQSRISFKYLRMINSFFLVYGVKENLVVKSYIDARF